MAMPRSFPRIALRLGLAAGLLTPAAAAAQVEIPDGPVPECRLFGRVVDAESGAPIAGTSVWIELDEADARLIAARATGPDGAFLFDLSQCRAVRLAVTMIGYADAEEFVDFAGGAGAYEVTIRLARAPLELETLTVEIPRSQRLQDVGFYARKAWVESTGKDLGQFYDPPEVEGRSAAIHTVGGIALRSRIRFIYGGCRPSFYVDGIRVPNRPRDFYMWLDMRVKPEDVEGIEIYRSMSAAVPLEFRDVDSAACGAVAVWTKAGRGRP
jgi:hypothetical protein